MLSALVPLCLGLMGIFGTTDEEKHYFNRWLRMVTMVLSIIATAIQTIEESYRFRSRGNTMMAVGEDMQRLINNYYQLTGPVFDPRNPSVDDLNQGSMEIPGEHRRTQPRSLPVADSRPLVADLTGIPIALLEAHMEVLREMEADAEANANNHSGDNFKRFVSHALFKARLWG